MPQQFIKVKENTGVVPNTAFTGSVKNQDWDSSSNLSNSTGDICRICHCEADAENPLLSPCYCSGSLKYVHQACLRQWLAASDTRSCELCKFNFILHTKIKPFSEELPREHLNKMIRYIQAVPRYIPLCNIGVAW